MKNKFDTVMASLEYYSLAGRIEATEEMIQGFEDQLGTTLPDGYREFLTKYGLTSAHKDPVFFDLESSSRPEAGSIGVFYGFTSNEDAYSIEFNWRHAPDRCPREFLCIAMSAGEGQICLALSGPNKGKVFLWYLVEEMDEVVTTLVGNDFDNFMKNLDPRERGS